jgi:PAS domain S-box-containing protein
VNRPRNSGRFRPSKSRLDPRESPRVDDLVRLTLEQATEHALILMDLDGTVLAWRMGAQRTFGHRAEEMLGKQLDVIFTPEDQATGIPELERETALKHGVGENDRWMVRKDGVKIFVTGVTSRLCDPSGTPVGFSKILRDRTDLRAQVDSLRNQRAALEAEDRRKDVLLGTLAHELRSPLGVLANAAQLIEIAAPEEPRLRDATHLVRRQVKYLESLVEDLLELGRVKAAKVTLEFARVDIRAVVDAAVETASASLRERKQAAEIILPQLELEADPIRLRQVFVNLISNASKFSPERTRIWIKGTTEGAEAVLRVVDEGHGIPPELLPRVFDLFTQGEAMPQGRGGLGLGLTLVKEYVELHGGRVQVRSEGPGRGSEFIVRLPLKQGAPIR